MIDSFLVTTCQAALVGGFGGTGWRSMRSSDRSRHAHLGALELQMFAAGLIEDGSSSVPTRTTTTPG